MTQTLRVFNDLTRERPLLLQELSVDPRRNPWHLWPHEEVRDSLIEGARHRATCHRKAPLSCSPHHILIRPLVLCSYGARALLSFLLVQTISFTEAPDRYTSSSGKPPSSPCPYALLIASAAHPDSWAPLRPRVETCGGPQVGCRGQPSPRSAHSRSTSGCFPWVPPTGCHSLYLRCSLLFSLSQIPPPLDSDPTLKALDHTRHPLPDSHVHACLSHYRVSPSRAGCTVQRAEPSPGLLDSCLYPLLVFAELLMSKTNYLYTYITALPHDLSPVWGHGDCPKGRFCLSLLSPSCY